MGPLRGISRLGRRRRVPEGHGAGVAGRTDPLLPCELRLRDVEQAQLTHEHARAWAQAPEQPGRAGGAAEPALESRVRQLAADLEADERDRRLVASLERVMAERAVGSQTYGRQWVPRYREAITAQGIDPSTSDPAEAAVLIGEKRPPVRMALVAALDEWLRLARGIELPERAWLRAVLAAVDPDEWRTRIRVAQDEGDRAALEALAGDPQMRDQPERTLWLLTKEHRLEHTTDLLRRAWEQNPGSFLINFTLGTVLGPTDPAGSLVYQTAAVSLRPDSAAVWTNLGVAQFDLGDCDAAVVTYERALDLEPDNAVAHNNLGAALVQRGELDAGIDACRRATELAPNGADGHYNLGTALMAKDLVEAVAALERAVELNPTRAEAHTNLGETLHRLGRLDEALESLRSAVEADPKLPTARYGLGTALRDLGHASEAEAEFRESIALQPDHPESLTNLGNELMNRGDVAGARELYEQALEANPRLPQALHGLGHVLYEQGDMQAAIARYREALAIEPSPETYGNLGNALTNLGDLAGAAEAQLNALEINPADPIAWNNLGVVRMMQGDLVDAEEAFRDATDRVPGYVDALVNLGLVLGLRGEHGDAAEALAAALVLQPELVGIRVLLGIALHRTGGWEEASEEWARALEDAPEDAAVHNDLAWALATFEDPNLRDPAWAVELAERAVDLAPTFAGSWNTLGVARYRAAEYDAAITALEKSMELQGGGNAVDGFFMAMALAWLDRGEEARKYYDQAVDWMEEQGATDEELGRFRAETEAVLEIETDDR